MKWRHFIFKRAKVNFTCSAKTLVWLLFNDRVPDLPCAFDDHTASLIWYRLRQQFLSYCLFAHVSGSGGRLATRSTGSHHEVESETSRTVLCGSICYDSIKDHEVSVPLTMLGCCNQNLLQGIFEPFNLTIRPRLSGQTVHFLNIKQLTHFLEHFGLKVLALVTMQCLSCSILTHLL